MTCGCWVTYVASLLLVLSPSPAMAQAGSPIGAREKQAATPPLRSTDAAAAGARTDTETLSNVPAGRRARSTPGRAGAGTSADGAPASTSGPKPRVRRPRPRVSKAALRASLYDQLGGELIGLIEEDQNHALVWAISDGEWTSGMVFIDLGDHVQCLPSSPAMIDLLVKTRNIDPPGKKWRYLKYDLRDQQFEVEFIYEDELLPGSDATALRDAAVTKRFGKKRVVYTPREPLT